ncbi:hypothetical protein AX15_001616 [Amanita polypyramis BW_CC]|nr:hypothetical protein AX15_001616 [Amanita polypyramis BW_CC]
MQLGGTALYAVTALLALVLYALLGKHRTGGGKNLAHIPTIGPSLPLLSYIGAIRFLYNAAEMIQQGYERFSPGVFKIAGLNHWIVVVCGNKFIEELRKAPDEVISFQEAANDMVQIPYTLGEGVVAKPYHIHVLSTQLTRNLRAILPVLRNEMILAIQDHISSTNEEDWVPVPTLETVTQVITRVSNCAFVGAPLCRDQEYVNLCKTFAVTEVLQAALIINVFPRPLRAFASRFFTRLSTRVNAAQGLLHSIITERKAKIESYGKDYPGRPNDLLQWILMDSEGWQATSKDLALRILAVNVAAIRTPSMVMTQALYHLAVHPELIQPMREEVEAVVGRDGWTKTSIDKMHKVDSFIRETMRVSDGRFLSMMRKATKPFSFSNGTLIPEGTMLFAASYPVHFDSSVYPNADGFDGFRFERLMEHDAMDGDDGGPRHRLVATSADYLAWGYGKYACPGRFFAAVTLKLFLAHLIVNYDLRLEQPGVRPPDFVIEANCFPNSQASVMFRQRRRGKGSI